MTKLGAFEDFIPKLKKAIEDAKNDLIKIKDEAIAKAARAPLRPCAEVWRHAGRRTPMVCVNPTPPKYASEHKGF